MGKQFSAIYFITITLSLSLSHLHCPTLRGEPQMSPLWQNQQRPQNGLYLWFIGPIRSPNAFKLQSERYNRAPVECKYLKGGAGQEYTPISANGDPPPPLY